MNFKYTDNDKFLVGSYYFFKDYDDYIIRDIDYIVIISDKENNYIENNVIHLKNVKENIDLSIYVAADFNEFLNILINDKDVNGTACLLVPEIINKFNISIDFLKKNEKLFQGIDDRHKYLKRIYSYYIDNNDFKLTDEQLKDIFEIYKSERFIIYN